MKGVRGAMLLFWCLCWLLVRGQLMDEDEEEDWLSLSGCQELTTNGYSYSRFQHASPGRDGAITIRFWLMAGSNGHVLLTTQPKAQEPAYEVVLGAATNSYSDVRRARGGRSKVSLKTPGILSEDEFRGFWIRYTQEGDLEVGSESSLIPFMYWKDPNPLDIHYFSFSAWTNVLVKWKFGCRLSPSKLKFSWYKLVSRLTLKAGSQWGAPRSAGNSSSSSSSSLGNPWWS